MCTIVNKDGRWIGTQKGLKEEVGSVVMIADSEYDPKVCLCGVDVDKTLEEAGVDFEYVDIFDEYIIK